MEVIDGLTSSDVALHRESPLSRRVGVVTISRCGRVSGVSRISFRGGFKIFLEKWGNLHGAKRHAARGEATRLLGGFGGMLPRENFKKWCNLVRFREYFAKILSKKYF